MSRGSFFNRFLTFNWENKKADLSGMKITVTCSPNNESFTYCQRISVSVIKLVFNINETLGHVCLGWCTLWRASALHHVSQQPQEGGDSFQGKRFKLQPQGETVCIIRTEVVKGTRGNCRNSPGVGALTSANGNASTRPKKKWEAGISSFTCATVTIFPGSTPVGFGETDATTDGWLYENCRRSFVLYIATAYQLIFQIWVDRSA